METLRRLRQALLPASLSAVLVMGARTLTAPRAQTLPPILLCAPTYPWVCSGPGGPDILFPGTVCEKWRSERQIGLTCVPYTG